MSVGWRSGLSRARRRLRRLAGGGGAEIDTIWSDYLASVGRRPKRLFEGTPIWDSIKQVVRANDRAYGPRPSDAALADASGDGAHAALLDEIMLFLQGQLLGDAQVLTRNGVTAETIETRFARGARTAEAALVAGRTLTLSLPRDAEIVPEAVCIENTTGSGLTGCRLVVGQGSWRDLDSIARRMLGPENDPDRMSPNELAFALLFSYRAAVTHGPKVFDRQNDPLARHPVALFNYFGQSTCGVLALSFATLCAKLGLEARVRKNACHTYAEIFLDGAWRIMDSDPSAEPFYPALDDARRLLGAEDLWGSDGRAQERVKLPSLTNRSGFEPTKSGRKQKRSAAFRSREQSRIVATGAELLREVEALAPIETDLRLRRGEKVIFGYGKGGPWYSASIPVSLPPKDRSILVREIDVLADPELSQRDGEGRLVVPLDHAYPILDATVTVRCTPGAPTLELRRNGHATRDIAPVAVTGDATHHFSLRRLLLRASPPDELEVVLAVPADAAIGTCRVLVSCQIASLALPRFRPGDNEVRLESTEPGAARLRLHYRAGAPFTADATATPEQPPDGGVVTRGLRSLRWHGESLGGPYRVTVAHDMEMRYIVASNLDRVVDTPWLDLDDDDRSLLESGRTYYWRVRPAGLLRDGPGSQTTPFSFRVQ